MSKKSKILYLYHCSQDDNSGYDTYSDCVVAAYSQQEAKETSPDTYYKWKDGAWYFVYSNGEEKIQEGNPTSWTSPDKVTVQRIGIATKRIKPGIICSSFHAG